MSWQQWAQQCLNNSSGKCSHRAGVFGHDGTKWGCTEDFELTPATARDAMTLFNSAANEMPVSKLTIGDKKYMVLQKDESDIKIKDGGAGGCICKGKTFIMVGLYDDNTIQPGNNSAQVCKARDLLNEST